MKRLLLPIVAALSLVAAPLFGVNKLKNIPSDKVVCLFDIHDTVVEKETGKRIKMGIKTAWHMIRSREARTIINTHLDTNGHCAGELIEQKLQERARYYLDLASQALKSGHTKQAKAYRHKAKRFMKLAHLFHNFELSYRNKDGVVSLLEALKQRGYNQFYVASNIGSKHYEHIKRKFPELFNDHMIKDGLTVDTTEVPLLKKPDHAYFKKLQKMYNSNGDKTLVFIDDKEQNVEAARRCGMIGIRIKSVKQCVEALNEEGLNLTYHKCKSHSHGSKHSRIHVS